MALILLIDVSGNHGFVGLSLNGNLLETIANDEPMNHAGFLQPAIKLLIEKNSYHLRDIDAIAHSNGPGSYTGLRVGLSSAKGLAYALNIPLININTLQLMAMTIVQHFSAVDAPSLPVDLPPVEKDISMEKYLICPMIDARRMEVFFALYDQQLRIMVEPGAVVITEAFLEEYLNNIKIVFTGNGKSKWQKLANNENAIFIDEILPHNAFAELSFHLFKENLVADIISAEPFYCKEFYQPATRP